MHLQQDFLKAQSLPLSELATDTTCRPLTNTRLTSPHDGLQITAQSRLHHPGAVAKRRSQGFTLVLTPPQLYRDWLASKFQRSIQGSMLPPR
jgi:hypothetical protein